MTYNLKELRQALKSEGFKLQIITYSDFKAGIIKDKNGDKMPSIFTKESKEYWQEALNVREFYKGQVYDGLCRVII